ncbi:MAG: 4Fe-4S dicluster domain-containing protein [Anaerolineales bacterium]|nr:4Fe-4S dicluster domain-containing protein [Anaerolineales bacterium]
MRFATMWNDVLTSLFSTPVTEQYPFERRKPPAGLRAQLQWKQEDCTGCGLCAMDCPSQAIEMKVLDKKAKRFVMLFYVDRCAFCAQCTYSCRQGCLKMVPENWELAVLDRKSLVLYHGEYADVEEVLAAVAEPSIA